MGKVVVVGFLVFAFALVSMAAAPSSSIWTLVRLSGEVIVPEGLAQGGTVPADATITTGADGRALLTRGGAAMLIGPGTTLTLDSSSQWTIERGHQVVEQSDAVIVHEKAEPPRPDFTLGQSILAAVVKA